MNKTLYELLEVSPNASSETIKAVYRSLLQRFHPDKNPDSAEATRHAQEIYAAYAILCDPSKRADYDEQLAGLGGRSDLHHGTSQSPYDAALDRQAKEFQERADEANRSATEDARAKSESEKMRTECNAQPRAKDNERTTESMAASSYTAFVGDGGKGGGTPFNRADGSSRDSEDVTVHSRINSWITLLFLAVVFAVLSSLLSKLTATFPWLRSLPLSPAGFATLSSVIGVLAALIATFKLGRFLAEIIPVRPPLSGILMTRGAPELNTNRERFLVTVGLVVLAPLFQVAGLVAESYIPRLSSLSDTSAETKFVSVFEFSYQLERAKLGHVEQQRIVGARYLRGDGVQQDYNQALYWLGQAAQKGDIDARTFLARMYRDGRGIPKNDSYALQLYIEGAREGNIVAQINLAEMLEAGEGGRQDLVSAYFLYSVAGTASSALKYVDVAALVEQRLAVLAALMTQSQIAEAQRQAAVWWKNRRR